MSKEKVGYRVARYIIKPSEGELFEYLHDMCVKSKNLYNTTNFYIRQVMTGIQKDASERQLNEIEVLTMLSEYLDEINEIRRRSAAKKNSSPSFFQMPTPDKWMLSYNMLEAIFKVSNNADYRALPAQVNQQSMKKCINAWKSYFKALKDWKKHPEKYNGRPDIPGYKRSQTSEVVFTEQVCQLKQDDSGMYLTFPKTDLTYDLGDYIPEDAVLRQVEAAFEYGNIVLSLLIEDKVYEPKRCTPKRIAGIDLGLSNIAAISNNIGVTPILIKGDVIKEKNQYFNKMKAELTSKLQKGKDSSHSQKHSAHLDAISRKRTLFFRDYFYKIGNGIIRWCKENMIDTVVVGINHDWKDSINMNRHNNQEFVCVPHAQFLSILRYLCDKNGIQFLETEESYTSKADFLKMDNIPVYNKDDHQKYKFSGRRLKRGVYKSQDGIILNADINGASNIIRKLVPDAFKEVEDLSYVTKATIWDFGHFYIKRKNVSLIG